MLTVELNGRYEEAIDDSDISVEDLEALIVNVDNAQDDETDLFKQAILQNMLHNLDIKLSVLCYQLTQHEDF